MYRRVVVGIVWVVMLIAVVEYYYFAYLPINPNTKRVVVFGKLLSVIVTLSLSHGFFMNFDSLHY